MSADAIKRTAGALADRLRTALKQADRQGDVYFGPIDDAQAHGAALILTLYRMVPSAHLRNSEHRVANAPSGVPEVYVNALPLDLYFLLTVGNGAGGNEHPLGVLGIAIQALIDSPCLTSAEVAPDPVRLCIEPLSTEEISRIWSLFPNQNYRTSVAYLATPVWVDPIHPAVPARAVLQDSPSVGQRPRREHV